MNGPGHRGPTPVLHLGLQALLLVTVVCVFAPFQPDLPMGDSESSWALGLNQAVAQGMVFGRDILYTLGPYSSISTRAYHPATDHLVLFGLIYLGLLFGTTLVLLSRGSRWYLLLAVWLVLAGFLLARDPVYVRDTLLLAYPFLVGVYCCTLLQRTGGGRGVGSVTLLLLLFSPFGLLPLVKGSFLVLCTVVALLAVLVLALHRQWVPAVAVAVSVCVSLPVFWLLSGQPLAALPAYLAALLPVIAGYSDAMFKYGSAREVVAYLVAAAGLMGVVLWQRSLRPVLRLYLFAVFFLVLFVAFKGGFVRHDGHAVAASATLVLAALVFALVFPSRRALAGVALCVCAWIYIDPYLANATLTDTLVRVQATYTKVVEGMKLRGEDRRLAGAYDRRLAQLRQERPLPLLEGTSDIYSYSQSYLIASGNTWNPRPVFQSYAAYSPALARLNRDHLQGDNAPDNLFFRVEPIDRRLPASEDGPSWPSLLARYRPGGLEHGYLFLHRIRGVADVESGDRTLPGGGSYAFGQPVPIPGGPGALVFATVSVDKSLPGILAGILFKPAELDITLTLEDGAQRTFRLVPGMAEAGFLLSPLIESTVQFARLYGAPADLADKQVTSFSILPAGASYQWQGRFEVAFTVIAPPPATDLGSVYTFAAARDAGEDVARARRCDGNIDAINGTAPAPDPFRISGVLEVNGWLAVSAAEGTLPDAALVVLDDGAGTRRLFETTRARHPWAGRHFGAPGMANAGFMSVVDVSGLSGDYTLGLALREGDRISICPGLTIPGTILGTGR